MATATKKAAVKKPAAKSDEADKPKRKSYTDEERLANLQAEMERVKAKAAEKRAKAIEAKREEKAKLDEKIAELRLKASEVQAEIDGLVEGGSIDGTELEAGDDPVVTAEAEAAAEAADTDAA